MKYLTFLFILSFFSACNQKQEAVQGQWIKGNEQEKLETIENQFRGFDMAMVETGYRYQELYWAGQDENWEYADHPGKNPIGDRKWIGKKTKTDSFRTTFFNRYTPSNKRGSKKKRYSCF